MIIFLIKTKCVIFNINSIPSIMNFLENLDGVSFGYFLCQYLMALIPISCEIFEYNVSTSNDARSVLSGTAEDK